MSIFLKVKVEKIYIYPLGGISKIKISLNDPIIKEFLILIAGPLFQFIGEIILIITMPHYIKMIRIYHYGILLFNLFPIYPLDGGKFINLLLSNFMPIKKSLKISIVISYIMVIIIPLALNIKLNIIILIVFLLIKIRKESRNINYNYNKFLLERFLYNYNFSRLKTINNLNKFYRNKRHIIVENNRFYSEKEYLSHFFNKINKKC